MKTKLHTSAPGWNDPMGFWGTEAVRDRMKSDLSAEDLKLMAIVLVYAAAVIIDSSVAFYARMWLLFGFGAAYLRIRSACRSDRKTTPAREVYCGFTADTHPLVHTLIFPPIGLFPGRSWRIEYGAFVAQFERHASHTIHHNTAWEYGEQAAESAAGRADEIADKIHDATVEAPLAVGRIALLLAALTGTAKTASAQDDGKATAEYAYIVPFREPEAANSRNRVSFTVEVVDKYHGMVVGEIFAAEPAPRFLARFTHTTTARGNFYVDSWNSVGAAFNMEADLGVGWEKSGWDVSATHFFVRGGDIFQLGLSKSMSFTAGQRKIPLNATLLYYTGTSATSPPGGAAFKLSTGFSHALGLGPNFKLAHRFAIGADNNPFGLGDGISSVGFYTVEAGYKNAYFAWHTTQPLIGRDNTTRGFRQSVSAGYRHSFAW